MRICQKGEKNKFGKRMGIDGLDSRFPEMKPEV